ncbi:MAG: hypothetical protein KKE23_01775 [Nanoarchaeota archaeon]|nr:hypothetical protein [Nanoarchaeota archaeon]
MVGKRDECIDQKFLESNLRLKNIFLNNDIKTYGQILDMGCRNISIKKGIGLDYITRIHNHLKKVGFREGLPGYDQRKKYHG